MLHSAPALGLVLDWVGAGLFRASTYGAVSVGAVWLVCRLAPRMPASARALLWWCATLKLIVDFTGLSPIPLPVLPGPAVASSTAAVASAAANRPLPDAVNASGTPDDTPTVDSARGETPVRSIAARPAAIVVTLWIAGLAVIGYRMVRRIWRTMEVVGRSTTAPGPVAAEGAALAARLGLRTTPRLRVSAEVPTPFVSGLGRLTVVLPAGLANGLPERELRMALCHELAHVRRSDTRLGCVPAFAECLFFFHPLAHLAAREYALGREAACDEVVLSVVGAAPREYGRLLLGLGVSRLDAGIAAAGASCSFSNLKRRIAMLRDPQTLSIRTRLVAAGAAAAAVLALAPVQLVAHTSPAQAPSPAQDARSALSYVFFRGNDESTTVSGSSQDIEHARQLRKAGESLLWFRLNGREYVVRDPALLRQFDAIWRPVGEIGAEEGKLGARQGQLGAKQGDLGSKQGEIGAQQGALGARQGSLGAKQGELASREAGQSLSAGEKADIEKQRQQIDQQMRELDVQMKQLDQKMRAFDQPMRELGEQMKALGKEMEALGRKMDAASAKAEADTKSLLDRAVAGGLAQPVK